MRECINTLSWTSPFIHCPHFVALCRSTHPFISHSLCSSVNVLFTSPPLPPPPRYPVCVRYVTYGLVNAKVAEEMRKPDVADFFARLIQRTSPKSYAQAMGETVVTRRFFENFSGDQVGSGRMRGKVVYCVCVGGGATCV